MSFGPVQSLNDEPIYIPKIRRDQHKRIVNIVRTNHKFPEIALGLVRDYIKGVDHFRACLLEDGQIKLTLVHSDSAMRTDYFFNLEQPLLLETPTLD